ncbi:MAG TPA: pre-peptidase C-terminal domain-containing protein [Noviherbaspirillum sp.]
MAIADYYPLVQKFYIAYFGRPADANGLQNMATQLNDAGAPTTTQAFIDAYSTIPAVRQIVDAFGNSNESAALYTGGTTEFVTAIFRNVLGRSPQTEGLNFWSSAIDSGTLVRGKAALSIMAGAEANTTAQGLIDAQLISNRVSAATTFTNAMDTAAEVSAYSGSVAGSTARDLLSVVTATTNLTDYQSNVVNTLANLASHSISAAGETDTVQYSLLANHNYRIEVQAAAGSTVDPEISQITDPSAAIIQGAANSDYGTSQNAQLTISPTTSGNYTISIKGQNSTTGNYVVNVTDLSTPAPTDDLQRTISAGQTYTGVVRQGFETKSVFFSLTAGHEYQFTLAAATSGNALATPVLRGIYDSTGKQVMGSYGQATSGTLTLNLTPTESGTYYGVIADAFDDNGAFTFTFSDTSTAGKAQSAANAEAGTRDADDFAASTATTGSVTIGGTTTGSIETGGDQDWIAAYLTAGHTYTFNLRGVDSSGGTLEDPAIQSIRNASGTVQSSTYDDDSGTGFDSRIEFTPTSTGYYYLVASSFDSYGTGTYTLSLSESSTDDYAASTSTSGLVTVGSTTAGNIETTADEDWIAAYLFSGHSYRFNLNGHDSSGGTLVDPVIETIRNSSGTEISGTYDDDGGTGYDSQVDFTPTSTGYYYVVARSVGHIGTGTYTLALRELYTDDYPETTSTTGSISVGGTRTGSIEADGDRDWIAAYLTAGHTYRFNLRGADSGSGTLGDPMIYSIANSSGTLISNTYDDDTGTGLEAQVDFTPGTTGYYYVIASNVREIGTGTYTLALTDMTSDDFDASTSTTGNVSVGGARTGSIESNGDQDWIAAYLTAGHTYRFNLRGNDGSGGTLADPVIDSIRNASGTTQPSTYDDDSGTGFDAQVDFTPTATGYYYLVARSAGSIGTGTYTLDLTESYVDDFPSTTATTGSVTVGSTRTGNIEANGDTDWIAAYLTAGHAYRFALSGNDGGGGTLADPVIDSIRDASGTTQSNTYDDDSGTGFDAQVDFTPTSTGYYYLVARSVGSTGTGTYTLRLTETGTSDDYAASMSTTGQVAVDSSVTGSIETETDQDWFAVNLTAGTTYTVRMQGQGANAGTLYDPVIYGFYYASSGSTTPYFMGGGNDDGSTGSGTTGRDSYTTFTPSYSGTHYIVADGFSSYTGTYTLSVSQSATDDFAASTSTTGSITAGGTRTGSIETNGDQDWIAAYLTAGHTYRFNLRGADSSGGTLVDPVIDSIRNASGTVQSGTYDDDGGTGFDSQVDFTPTSTGYYYLVARSVGNSGVGTYTLALTESSVDDYTETTATTGTVTVGSSATGTIETSGDEDWFAVNLTAGTTYTVRLQGQGANAGTLYDPYLNGFYYSSGSGTIPVYLGGYNDDSSTGGGTTGRDSMVTFTPSYSGTHYISAGAYSSYTGTYRLSINSTANAEGDSIANNTGTNATVSVGGSTTGTIDSATDADWFAVNLTAGYLYNIQLQGSYSSNGTLSDPVISGLYNSSGTFVSNTYADDQNGTDSQLSFAPTSTGTYYISAEGYGSATGTYLLSVQQGSADIAGSTATSGSLTVGGSANVTVDYGYDHDWYAVTLTGGNTYQFTLSGTGTNNYPVIYGVYDASGSYVSGYATGVSSGSTTAATTTFTPTTTGTYYVDAYSYYTGSYTLTAAQVATDIAANTSTTGTLAVGGSTTVTINQAYDHDWYGIALTAGTTYQFTLSSTSANSYPTIYGIYNASGSYVDGYTVGTGSGSDASAVATFTPTTTGTYYVDAYSYYAGTYTLSAAQVASDIAASTSTTGTVSVGSSVTGTIGSAADADWYAVSLTGGVTYNIQLQGAYSNNGTLHDPLISGIYNSSGTLMDDSYADDSDGLDSSLDFTPTTTGMYYVAAEGYGTSVGTFRLSVSQIASSDLAANTSTTGRVLVNGTATSSIETANDQDWFAVSLTAGTRYQIDLEGSPTSGGTLSDTYLHGVYNSSGTLISGTTDDDSGYGADSRIIFDASSTGTYYIGAGAYSSNTGTYTVAVTNIGTADIAANSGTTATVSPGSSVAGIVDTAGDADWYAVSLTAGQTYTIDLTPNSTGSSPLNDAYLYGIYNSAGSLISGTTDDDSGVGNASQVVYTATSSGTHYISAGGYSGHTGNYILSVSSGTTGTSGGGTTTTDLSASTSTTGTVSTTASASSTIDTAGDQDWFSVSLTAGHNYNISLAGASSNSGTLADPYLRGIYNSAGSLISGTTDDDAGYGQDALVSYTPTTSGTYYISAGAYADGTGTYSLSVSDTTSTSTTTTTPVTSGSRGTWTIMVYVAADNNLEAAALVDINEMEAANLPQNVRVTTLVDRSPGSDASRGYSNADGDWTDTRFGVISRDSNLNHISSTLTSWGERNTGSASTLTEFINASALAAPADHYALVIWDHGGGISGVAWDDSSYSANLSMNEVSQAISGSNVAHFDIVGFDTCYQGVLDQAYVLRNQADYTIASQDFEPGEGWDYTNWLSVFQQSADPSARQVATQAVDSYEAFFRAQGRNSVTLSVLNNAEVGDLATAWSSFAQAMNSAGTSAMQTLRTARAASLDFQRDTYVDLHSLMTNFMQRNSVSSLDAAAQTVINALGDVVLETGGLTTARGLTVYMPDTTRNSYLDGNEFPITALTGVNAFYDTYWV